MFLNTLLVPRLTFRGRLEHLCPQSFYSLNADLSQALLNLLHFLLFFFFFFSCVGRVLLVLLTFLMNIFFKFWLLKTVFLPVSSLGCTKHVHYN